MTLPTPEEYEATLKKFAEKTGYTLNPDPVMLREIVLGLLENRKRFGYASCPCRVASGKFQDDKDIVCPCAYRDPDLKEYARCYCALYVNEDYISGRKRLASIPERRPIEKYLGSL